MKQRTTDYEEINHEGAQRNTKELGMTVPLDNIAET
jgi:hypothetical protein